MCSCRRVGLRDLAEDAQELLMPVPQVAGVGHVRLLRHPEPARLLPAVGLAAARLRRRQGVPQGTVGFTQDATLWEIYPRCSSRRTRHPTTPRSRSTSTCDMPCC